MPRSFQLATASWMRSRATSSVLSSRICTMSRSRGQSSSQAASMTWRHTSRSLNMGSWTTTLG